MQKADQESAENIHEKQVEDALTGEKDEKEQKKTEKMQKKVLHAKYGTGVILSEDDIIIKVLFDDYGEKELMKALAGLTYEDD